MFRAPAANSLSLFGPVSVITWLQRKLSTFCVVVNFFQAGEVPPSQHEGTHVKMAWEAGTTFPCVHMEVLMDRFCEVRARTSDKDVV